VAGGALIDPCAASFASDKAPQASEGAQFHQMQRQLWHAVAVQCRAQGMSGIFLGTYQAVICGQSSFQVALIQT